MPRLLSALRPHRVWVAVISVAVSVAAGLVRDAIHVTGQVNRTEWVFVVVAVAAGAVALWALVSLGMERRHHQHP